MLDALVKELRPYGYNALYHYESSRMNEVVRGEMHRPNPRRTLVAQHNGVTRDHANGRRTVIADTFQDGYKQITSFCRYVRRVENCDTELEECMLSETTMKQIRYRWASDEMETNLTYIDLPLSSAHPALSTTVIRRVFPDVTLNVQQYNVAGSACDELPALRKIYKKSYGELEAQNRILQKRILYLAGYPTRTPPGLKISLPEMMDAAEQIESGKYNLKVSISQRKPSSDHKGLMKAEVSWNRDENGVLFLGKGMKPVAPKP